MMAAPREAMIATGARVFGAGTVLLLALVDASARSAITAAAICGLAAAMSALTLRLHDLLVPLAVLEALIGGVIIGIAMDDFASALAYCLVPPFVTGLGGRWGARASAIVVQFLCIALLTLAELRGDAVQERLELSVPWLLTSAGAALLAHWLVEAPVLASRDDTGYESARRLLTQLRTVSRRLSAGLDPVGIAQQILTEIDLRANVSLAVLLARADSGTLQPLAELAAAVALVPRASAWWGALGALALLLLFVAGIGANLARGKRPDCHCFGQIHSAPAGWQALVRNGVLAAVAALVLWQGREDPGRSAVAWLGDLSTGGRLGLGAGLLGLALLGGYDFRRDGRRSSSLRGA